ncbi:MAG TPA: hypothetical protein VFZ72_03345 [Jiangellaceae bacterium]
MATDSGSSKHVAAFLGAPAGTYALAALVWLTMKETCDTVGGQAVECVRVAGAEFGIAGVISIATIVAFVLAVVIENS